MTEAVIHRPSTREDLVYRLRKNLGDAADSPTLGYYRDLPDPVLAEVTDQVTSLHARMMTEGVLSYGFMIAAAGSMVADAKQLAAGFAVVAVGLAVDAVRVHKMQDKVKDRIFALTT